MIKIEYITSNRQKFEEAKHILHDYELEQLNLALPEIQGESEEIIYAKAKAALRVLERPLIIEDVSFCCNALKGLPGPYIKDFLRKLGDVGLYELVYKFKDHKAQAVCIAAFIKPGMEPVLFKGVTEGSVVAPKGNTKHGPYSWNSIFAPTGSQKTFGEFTLKELSTMSVRYKALTQLKEYLSHHL